MEEDKQIEEEKKPKRSTTLSFKHWVIRTVLVAIISIASISVIEYIFHIQLITQTLIAVITVFILGLSHEGLHYYQAIKLKYQVKWYRTRFTMGFTIDHPSIRGQITPEKQKIKNDINTIGRFPYYFLFPISIALPIIGFFTWYWGFIAAGAVSLVFHILMFSKEGTPVAKKKVPKVPSDDGSS